MKRAEGAVPPQPTMRGPDTSTGEQEGECIVLLQAR